MLTQTPIIQVLVSACNPHIVCQQAHVAVAKAVVLVAIRDIDDGEELYFDYGYDPSSKHCPEWFQPVLYPPGVH
jgi:hypothetical protein